MGTANTYLRSTLEIIGRTQASRRHPVWTPESSAMEGNHDVAAHPWGCVDGDGTGACHKAC